MNRIIFSALLLSGVAVNAQQQQVGINTAEPKATLHVEAGASENKGVIIPRITAAEMKAMTTGLGADHHSMMTYLKEDLPSVDQTGKLAEVTKAGYYFYDNTTGVEKWKALGGEQDFKAIPGSYGRYSYLSKKSGVGGNGTSVGTGDGNIAIGGNALYSNTTGNFNIAQGHQALYSNTTGHFNIAQGVSALYSNTDGYSNIAQGGGALYSNTTGHDNIAQGNQALNSNTTGHFNIAQGNGALRYNTIGENNIAIGRSALQGQNATPITGNYNIALGADALYNNTTGNHNIALGEKALQGQIFGTPITGNYNIALGANALQNTTTGEHNIAQGYQALNSNTTGNSNIAQGNSALYSNTTGKFNIAQGNSALRNNTTGDFNVAQGYEALTSNTTGGGNVAQGNSTLRNNTSGEYNVAQGLSALYNNTTGSHNIAQGFQALFKNTTGVNNIAQGNLALFNNTTGKNNIAFGENALKGQILGTPMTADGNIALGKNALQDNTTGGLNIALGQDALYSNTTGGWNIAQGLHALYKNTSGEQNIALGRNALYQNTSGQQNIGIGDGALSDNLTGQFNTAVGGYAGSWIKGNGNVHIGSGGGIPSAELDNVVLIGRLTNTLDATTANDNVILLGDTSPTAPKVGIGTYKPGAKLEVNNGTTAGAVKIVDGTQGAGKVLTSDADGLATWKSITLFTGTERIGAYHWGVGTALGNTNWNKIASITVPPGASMVYVKIHLLAGGLTSGAARAYVGKKDIGWNNSNTNDTPIGGSALFVTYHGIDPELQTSFIYNNTTNSNETLYLNLQSNQPTAARSGFEYPTGGVYLGTKWIENQFSAIPMN